MARAIFINRFYWPDEPATAQLLTDLAEALAARGLEVVVITSHPRRSNVRDNEVHNGVQIIRVGSSRSAGLGVTAKALDFITFHFTAFWRLLRTARRGDAVVAMTDPPLLGIAAWLAAGLRGARLFHWVQDIYPDLAIELSGHSWPRLIRPLRNLAWRRAASCATLGHDMAAVLRAAGVTEEQIAVTPNWAPAGLSPDSTPTTADLRAEWGLHGKFVVEYSGNLGRVHDLDPVIAVARLVRSNPRLQFLFVGGGARRAALEAAAAREALANIQFRPPQPRERLGQSLAVGNVHLVTVLPGCERYVFPSKLYGILAVGRPVIFIGPADCELARLVVRKEIGFAFQRGESSAIAECLERLAAQPEKCESLGRNALSYAAEAGGLGDAADRWHQLLAKP